jgi:hypothetical protein
VALAASVLAWESLDANLGAVVAHTVATQPPASLRQWPALPALSAPLPERPVPRFVGAGPAARRPLALTVHEPEWALLDLLARHLLLPCDLVAVALGWSDTIMRRRCSALAQQGLVRLIEAAELGQGGREAERYADLVARRPYEVTATGLAALAAWQGLTTRAAIRCNGYAGGGPDQPCGDRASRLAAPWHTLGVETLFASLAHGARRAVRHGADAGLIEWRNAAASTWDRFRPDAYLVYRHGAAHYAAFLEYDRGTMGRRDWRQKLSAYYAYRDSGFYRRDYAGFPTLLIVITTADAGAGDAAIRAAATEDLIAGVLSDLAISRAPLPALLTTEQRVQVDPAGFLGPIWREATSAARRTWPLAAGSSQSRPPTLARPAWQPRLPPDEQDDDRDAPLPGARAPPPHTIPP